MVVIFTWSEGEGSTFLVLVNVNKYHLTITILRDFSSAFSKWFRIFGNG